MEDIKISVIVPAYNIENYIEKTLKSILNQTHKNLEVILVDDGSRDHTGDIIDRYAKIDARVIPIHKENEGVSIARQSGLKRATGSYIGFIDGDDYIEEEMYEALLNNALQYKADISHCGYKMVFPDGHVDKYYGTEILIEQDHDKGLMDLILGELVEPSICNKLYKRELIEDFYDSPLWDPSIKNYEDLLMNFIVFSRSSRSVFHDRMYYHYILRKGSAASGTSRNKITDPVKVMTIIKNSLNKDGKLYPPVYERYIRTLLQAASRREGQDDGNRARQTLREEWRSKNISNGSVSKKLKYMVFGSVFMPHIYQIVRNIYGKVSGVDHKFDL